MSQPYRKKLIEVALPLEAINKASAKEKSIRHGHPSTLHLWWARRPLATCRAVLFASLVDDPSSHPEKFPSDEEQDIERQRLFRLIEELVQWENISNEKLLAAAHREIVASAHGLPPAVYDPFCGGGSIPLEAQRLGLTAHGSDLNPVAVLITKALVEIPASFSGSVPVNPEARARTDYSKGWVGAQGLAQDVRYYGLWMRAEAAQRVGNLYPKAQLPKNLGGGKATVVAWLWARTVLCPNPSCGAVMPLVRSFALSTKKGNEVSAIPVPQGESYRFEIAHGPDVYPGTVDRRGARCVCCWSPVPLEYVRGEGRAGRMSVRMMAIAAEGDRGRIYLPPQEEQERAATLAKPAWVPETELPAQALGFRVQAYGMHRHADLFTARQLSALTVFSDLVGEARKRVIEDGGTPLYADAVATYLGFLVSAVTDDMSAFVTWRSGHGTGATRSTFARQALPMVWDFAEANPFAGAAGDILSAVDAICRVIEACPAGPPGLVAQMDATQAWSDARCLVSTDPPYYDNIGYADLSDFFYSWMRPTLKSVYPALFATLQVPKTPELVATPFRFDGDRDRARVFFEEGLGRAFARMREAQHPDYPLTVYYAFKQAETDTESPDEGGGGETSASTGWETMLQGLLKARFSIDGTWPVRTERGSRSVSIGTNALASSIVLVCRPLPADASVTTRADFLRALKLELPHALTQLQRGNIAPVDLAQAAIGPGMSVFSRYAKVLDSSGEPMSVREALAAINQVLDEALASQEGDFDAETRWALAWFDQCGFEEGDFGVAETLSKAKNTSVAGLVEAHVLSANRGKVRLLRPEELSASWDAARHAGGPAWEVVHHLVRALATSGETGAADLLRKLGNAGESARELAYRLFSLCERRKRAPEALAYNGLVQSWPEIRRLAREERSESSEPRQAALFGRG